MITITQTQIDQLLTLIRQRYPDWQNVHHPAFDTDEIRYKQQAVDLMRVQLGRAEYERLLRGQLYEEIVNRLTKVAQATNLLYLSTPQSGDLRILYDETVDQGKLCHRLFQLLYSDAAIEVRLQSYIDFLQQYDPRLNYWTFATYYLFLAHPDREMFVKPRLTEQYLAWFGLKGKWNAKLNVDTYVTIVSLAQQLQQGFKPYGATSLLDVQSLLWVAFYKPTELLLKPAKRNEFTALFSEFLATYPQTRAGQTHITAYSQVRVEAARNYHAILTAKANGEDVTDRVLKQLLPYTDTAYNRDQNAWIHPAPAVTKDIRFKYERSHWWKPTDWSEISNAILHFTKRCVEHPAELMAACKEFAASPYSKGFQAGMLTPMLNALAPADFALINSKPIAVLTYLTGASFKQGVADYPAVNTTMHRLHDELADILATAPFGLPAGDTFDIFCHWLVAVKGIIALPDGEQEDEDTAALTVGDVSPEAPEPITDSPFSKRTFELLALIHADPTSKCYAANKDDFVQYVEEPFKRVMLEAGRRLPPAVREVMETEKRIFARFNKNDWGQGGAWDFYWGAFYPKGSKRSKDAQLSMWMNYRFLEFGFYIGDYASEQRLRFQRNCERNAGPLSELISSLFREGEIILSARAEFTVQADGVIINQQQLTWGEFIRNPSAANCDASLIVPSGELLTLTFEELVQRIVHGHQRLFPLVLAALEEDPMPHIFAYLEPLVEDDEGDDDESLDSIPSALLVASPAPYSATMFLQETSLEQHQMVDLLALLQDKQQLILQGPPGTGKTYVAQRLAKLLTGLEQPAQQVTTIQFHPSYGYEDFIEGIRPESKLGAAGQHVVDYPVLPGRFREFCERAARHDNNTPFVFIIDEINRGNLPRIFGELMYLLEYRKESVLLPYSGKSFQIPPNVYLIGTMNTADRSIALVDFALRRRFHFVQMAADPDLFTRWLATTPISIPYLAHLYQRLCTEAIEDENYRIGPSYLMDPALTEAKLERIWRYTIEPLLDEYYAENKKMAKRWAWNSDLLLTIRNGG